MRIVIAYILALIVLLGSTIPCCAEEPCKDQVMQCSDQHEDEQCACSPFFTCATCPGFIDVISPVALPVMVEPELIHTAFTQLYALKVFPSQLFQPPRFA